MSPTSRHTEYGIRNTEHTSRFTFDVLLVGVSGQGVLTIGELIAETAHRKALPVNLYPTKGMAQRGGFVKAQLRLGREAVGATIPEKGADLVIAMEVSEALKAVRFIKPGGDLILFGQVWAPAAVMLGRAAYPTLEQVLAQVEEAGGRVHFLDPAELPTYEGSPVPANVFVLGAALGQTALGGVLSPSDVAQTVRTRWKRGVERNTYAFQSGLEVPVTRETTPR
jgi:indolepyruvate ferredoxin oxidoreductase beta subunit